MVTGAFAEPPVSPGNTQVVEEPANVAYDLVSAKVYLRHADAVAVARALGGDWIPESPAEVEIHARETERVWKRIKAMLTPPRPDFWAPDLGPVSPFPLSTLIKASRADNSILIRSTPEDIESFREIVALLDVPRRTVRVTVTCNKLSLKGLTLDRERLQLSGEQGEVRLSITLHPRVFSTDTSEIALQGSVIVRGRSSAVHTHVRLRSGVAVRVLSLKQVGRPVTLWIRAEVEDTPSIRDTLPG